MRHLVHEYSSECSSLEAPEPPINHAGDCRCPRLPVHQAQFTETHPRQAHVRNHGIDTSVICYADLRPGISRSCEQKKLGNAEVSGQNSSMSTKGHDAPPVFLPGRRNCRVVSTNVLSTLFRGAFPRTSWHDYLKGFGIYQRKVNTARCWSNRGS